MRHYNSTPPTILAQKAYMFLVPFFHKLGGQERDLPEVIHHLETAPLGLGIAASEIGPERRRDNTEGVDGMARRPNCSPLLADDIEPVHGSSCQLTLRCVTEFVLRESDNQDQEGL